MVISTNAAIKASYKRCLIRKQGDCRQRKKEETKGAETTLSRLWVISENITAVAFLSAPGGYFNTVSAFKGNNSLLVTKQQCFFSCSVLQCDSGVFSQAGPEIWAKLAADREAQSSPFCLPEIITHMYIYSGFSCPSLKNLMARFHIRPVFNIFFFAVRVCKKKLWWMIVTDNLPCAGNPLTCHVRCVLQCTTRFIDVIFRTFQLCSGIRNKIKVFPFLLAVD